MAPNIPDRWLDYKPVGEIVKGTRFIAFKVPLREHIVKFVPSDIRLDCYSLLDKIPDLGLIIDLTNTNRYYDPNTFRQKGIGYEKLMIPGHQLPQRQFVEKFNTLVNNFLQQNANNVKLIGVHCTHGVNRTGYLISNFMISELKISPIEAIKSVEEARGHAIERLNYRNHLLDVNTTATGQTTGSTYNESHRFYNDSSQNSNSRRYDNNKSEMPSNNRTLENWRAPQSNSNNPAQSEISFVASKYHNNPFSQRRCSNERNNEIHHFEHRSSFDRNEDQGRLDNWRVSQSHSNSTMPLDRFLPENRIDVNERRSTQKRYYDRNERDERQFSHRRKPYERDDGHYHRYSQYKRINGRNVGQDSPPPDGLSHERYERQYCQSRDQIPHDEVERQYSQPLDRLSHDRSKRQYSQSQDPISHETDERQCSQERPLRPNCSGPNVS
ncbi:RNA/RNP complex-1-interacting phosphatase [Eupeodes corollae]|uniref:RNA/RNP complex-1-interacting phosphatase n=1 Tax=Eupeodes corollae TaxID=290404 RepID=UPI00248F9EA8|nr:RNA/RNP complex-1-interacting phosphatase [Eupeodes corollae]